MTPKTLTCVLVDDEQSNLDILVTYVNQIPYLALKATFNKPLEALAYLLKTPTDLLITDISMPRLSGIDLYESLRYHVHTQVIFVSGYVERIIEALQFSVVDYLQKPVSTERFEQATQKAFILTTGNQKTYNDIPSEFLEMVLVNYSTLSPAQQRVFEQIAKGKSTKEIADILFIADGTVSLHRSNIRGKLGIPTDFSLKEIAIYIINTKMN